MANTRKKKKKTASCNQTQNSLPLQKAITKTGSTLYTLESHVAGYCVCTCVCVRKRRGGPCGDRKSTGARKQTNKAKAAVIKSSLVLVMHRNAAERHTALSYLTQQRPKPRAWYRPLLHATVGVYPETLCVSTSAGTYKAMSVLDLFCRAGRGRRRAPQPIAAGLE